MAVSHVKSNTVPDFTGTITGFNSQASTVTMAATDLVRPIDWNSVHNQFYTLSGNTNLNSTASGTNVVFQGVGKVTLIGSTATIGISVPSEVLSYFAWPQAMVTNTDVLAIGASQHYLQPFILPQDLSVSFIRLPLSLSLISTTFTTGAAGYSGTVVQSNTLFFNIYTQGTGASSQSLQFLTQASTSYAMQISRSGTASTHSVSYHFTFPTRSGGGTNTTLTTSAQSSAVNEVPAGTSDWNGWRLVDIPFETSLSAGNYWMGIQRSSTTAGGQNIGINISGLLARQITMPFAFPGSATNSSILFEPGLGSWSTNSQGGTTSSIPLNVISSSASHPKLVFQMARSA